MTRSPNDGYIGPGLVIHGRLTGKGEIQIDGRLEGDLVMEGKVHVGETGVVMAAIESGAIHVTGYLRGNVVATEEVVIHDGGHVQGDVRAPRVCIDDGGALHGGIEMEFELPGQGYDGPPR